MARRERQLLFESNLFATSFALVLVGAVDYLALSLNASPKVAASIAIVVGFLGMVGVQIHRGPRSKRLTKRLDVYRKCHTEGDKLITKLESDCREAVKPYDQHQLQTFISSRSD
jgi:hypothetical protein